MHDGQNLQYMYCACSSGASRRGALGGSVQEGTDRDARRRRALLAGGQEDDDDVEADPFDPSALFGGRSGLPAWQGGARPRLPAPLSRQRRLGLHVQPPRAHLVYVTKVPFYAQLRFRRTLCAE